MPVVDDIVIPVVEVADGKEIELRDGAPLERSTTSASFADCGENRPACPSKPAAVTVFPVDFEVLGDGTLVETIQAPYDTNRTLLLIWKNGEARYTDKFEYAGRVLVPIPKTTEVLKRIRLPKRLMPYESVRVLFIELKEYFSQFVILSNDELAVLAAFVLCSWIVDCLYVAPYLALVGLPQSGKTTLLRALNLVCRRPLLIADTPPAAIYEAYEQLRPTLLIDEAGFFSEEAALRRLLRAGCTRDVNLIRGIHAHDVYGPKAMSWIDPPVDPALNSRCFQIQMVESRHQLRDPSDTSAEMIADDFQGRLLQFRLDKFAVLQDPESFEHIDVYRPENMDIYPPRSRDMLKSFMAPLGNNSEFCEDLRRAFQRREILHKEPLPPEHSAILAALYAGIHQNTFKGGFQLSDVTRSVNGILKLAREPLRLHARKIGAMLTTLGFREHHRKNTGWVVHLCRADLMRIHELVDRHGIEPLVPTEDLHDCPVCAGTDNPSKKSQKTDKKQ
jgi:hypothetical protein